jgi:hypothetical protein
MFLPGIQLGRDPLDERHKRAEARFFSGLDVLGLDQVLTVVLVPTADEERSEPALHRIRVGNKQRLSTIIL